MIALHRSRRRSSSASCREMARVLQRYLDREIDEHTARRVARHLERCRQCGLEVAVYEEIKRSLRRRVATLPVDAVERLNELGAALGDSVNGPPSVG